MGFCPQGFYIRVDQLVLKFCMHFVLWVIQVCLCIRALQHLKIVNKSNRQRGNARIVCAYSINLVLSHISELCTEEMTGYL